MAVRVGDAGRAVSSLSPRGSVEIGGVLHKARSEGETIEAGSGVIAIGGEPAGYVVRKVEPGQPQPRLANHGAPISRAPGQRSPTDPAAEDQGLRAARRQELLKDIKEHCVLSASLGGMIGLTSGLIAWSFGRTGDADAGELALLLGASLIVGAAWGVVLMLGTGWFQLLWAWRLGNAKLFAPSYFALLAGLTAAAAGFWGQFETGDAGRIAARSIGASLGAWVVALLIGRIVLYFLETDIV